MEAGEGFRTRAQQELGLIRLEERRAYERRPLGSRFQDTCRQTRAGGGLPETEEGDEGGIPAGITHDLVLQFDLPARKMEREERLLAMNGGDLNETLREICIEGGGKDARFLLAHGADTNRGAGISLVRAAESGHLAVVEALLDAGAGMRNFAFAWAAAGNHTAVVALLLDRGVDVHDRDDMALHNAAFNGHLETTKLLLDRGADLNSMRDHRTVLRTARYRGHYELAALLLARGAVDEAA